MSFQNKRWSIFKINYIYRRGKNIVLSGAFQQEERTPRLFKYPNTEQRFQTYHKYCRYTKMVRPFNGNGNLIIPMYISLDGLARQREIFTIDVPGNHH